MGSKEILKSDTKISTENDKDRKNLSIILAFPVSSSASSTVSYTHLDVYKRQMPYCLTHSRLGDAKMLCRQRNAAGHGSLVKYPVIFKIYVQQPLLLFLRICFV